MNSAALESIEDAGTNVLTLTEDIAHEDFLRSRLTRTATRAQVLRMADALQDTSEHTRQALPEIDWAGWNAVHHRLRHALQSDADEALWFAVQALVPATLMWLRLYRVREPERLLAP
jgi:uncharacterized protein with HEPN domain